VESAGSKADCGTPQVSWNHLQQRNQMIIMAEMSLFCCNGMAVSKEMEKKVLSWCKKAPWFEMDAVIKK
jgi:hypothetical protein